MSGISFVLKGSQSFSAYSTTDPLSSRSLAWRPGAGSYCDSLGVESGAHDF